MRKGDCRCEGSLGPVRDEGADEAKDGGNWGREVVPVICTKSQEKSKRAACFVLTNDGPDKFDRVLAPYSLLLRSKA